MFEATYRNRSAAGGAGRTKKTGETPPGGRASPPPSGRGRGRTGGTNTCAAASDAGRSGGVGAARRVQKCGHADLAFCLTCDRVNPEAAIRERCPPPGEDLRRLVIGVRWRLGVGEASASGRSRQRRPGAGRSRAPSTAGDGETGREDGLYGDFSGWVDSPVLSRPKLSEGPYRPSEGPR